MKKEKAQNERVREMLCSQMGILIERSKQKEIPLIALDGLSNQMAKIGRVLLDNGNGKFVEFILLQSTVRVAQAKVEELMNMVWNSNDDDFIHDVYDRLDELRAMLTIDDDTDEEEQV